MFGRRKQQTPSLLSKMLIGDIDVTGRIEVVVPKATDRKIVINISTEPIDDEKSIKQAEMMAFLDSLPNKNVKLVSG